MWENDLPITIYPIGIIENEFNTLDDWDRVKENESLITLYPSLVNGLQGMLPGQQVMVLFHLNRIHEFDLLQHPRGNPDLPKRGVFTLRSPRRPNSIGVTIVEIVSVENNVLRVRGLDAFNGTPVIDLKPA